MEPILRNPGQDWISITLFISLIFLAVAKGAYYQRFMDFIILPLNNKYIFMYNKKDRIFNVFTLLVSAFQLINFALFLYYTFTILNTQKSVHEPIGFYFTVLGFLTFFILTKILIQLGNGTIFNISKIMADIAFKKISFLNQSGIVMCIANILLTYVWINAKIVIFLSIFLIILINLVGWVTTIRNHQNLIISNIFYFILYLCALEIAPLIIIGSYLKD